MWQCDSQNNSYIFLHSINQFVLVKRKLNISLSLEPQYLSLGVEPLTKTKTPIKLATKCNKNEKQDSKNNAEL